ncbi:MAG: hypothetical protein NT120_03335 [Candidatus Aenigmarchaeota archaeon]|nr:hypothetical protein [Candidatus Aenigmarchaeota archaeon]
MKLNEAIQRAEENENVQRLDGYFLSSTFVCIAEKENITNWTLLYYNPYTNTVVDCFVNEALVTVGEETPALNEQEELRIKDVKIAASKALADARKKFKKSAVNVLISLHRKQFAEKKCLVWTIAFITQDMKATSFDIDAATGTMLKEETISLVKKM